MGLVCYFEFEDATKMSKESYNIQDFLRIFGVNYSPVSIKHPPALNSVIRDRAVILDMVKHLNLRRRSTLICKGIFSERFDWNMKTIFIISMWMEGEQDAHLMTLIMDD